jgi:AraC family transcriptional regulator
MDYIQLISDSINFIEDNLDQDLTLETLAQRYFLSKFHYSRVFKVVTHHPLKSYIDERRMVAAANLLQNSQFKIIDIALKTGFKTPEVFSRRFREFSGLTPLEYRRTVPKINLPPKIEPVIRDFKNLKKEIIVRFTLDSLTEIPLYHQCCYFNSESQAGFKKLHHRVSKFVTQYLTPHDLAPLYTVTDSESGGPNSILYRFGSTSNLLISQPALQTFVLPASRYAVFHYKGDLNQIFLTVFEDICCALIAENLQIKKNGLDFFEIYNKDYLENGFKICVPVF